MSTILLQYLPEQFYMGVPQPDKLQVYFTPENKKAVVSEITLTNLKDESAELTLLVGTNVVMVYQVGAKESRRESLSLVLNPKDVVALKQSDGGQVSVCLNGSIAP